MKKVLTFFVIAFLLLGILPIKSEAAGIEPQVKIELKRFLGNQTSISLAVTGSYKVNGTSTYLYKDRTYTIKAEDSYVTLYEGTKEIESALQISITPVHESYLAAINNRQYYGSFLFNV